MNTLAEPVPWCRSLQGRGLLSEVRKSDKKSIHYFRKFNKNILQRSFDTWLRRKSLCQWKAHTLQLTKVDIFAIGRTGLAKIPLRQEAYDNVTRRLLPSSHGPTLTCVPWGLGMFLILSKCGPTCHPVRNVNQIMVAHSDTALAGWPVCDIEKKHTIPACGFYNSGVPTLPIRLLLIGPVERGYLNVTGQRMVASTTSLLSGDLHRGWRG